MSGNTFGHLFKVTTFGESHGPSIGCIVDGCPPGLNLNEEKLQVFLDKRKPGSSSYTSQRREEDKVSILSGVFEGKTTGTPIALIIHNLDQKSKDYHAIKDLFRPGHADFTYFAKYKLRDYRGGGRASARETAARVAAGAIARLFLKEQLNIDIYGFTKQIGELSLKFVHRKYIYTNPFFCPNNDEIGQIEDYIKAIRKEGDSVGALVSVIAQNVPAGLGEPVFDKLDADLARALMSINAVKGVEIGAGFASVTQKGSSSRDEMTKHGFLSNNAGGILGGISTGQPIIANMAFKPTSSIIKPGRTVDIYGKEQTVVTKGRHDPCVGFRGVPIAESMMALTLIDHYLRHKAQNLFWGKYE